MSTVRIGRDDYDPSRKHRHEHEHETHHGLNRAHHVPILPIPDLRFEHTYLKNIRPHVQVAHVDAQVSQSTSGEKGSEFHESSGSREVVRVSWGNVIWVTTKEQVLSPLVQGVIW